MRNHKQDNRYPTAAVVCIVAAAIIFLWVWLPAYWQRFNSLHNYYAWSSYERTDTFIAIVGLGITIWAGYLAFRGYINTALYGRIHVLWVEDNPNVTEFRRAVISRDRRIRITSMLTDKGSHFRRHRKKISQYYSEPWKRHLHARLNAKAQPFICWKLFKFLVNRHGLFEAYIVDLSLAEKKLHTEWQSGMLAIQEILKRHKNGRQPLIIVYSRFFSINPYSEKVPDIAKPLRHLLESPNGFDLPNYCIIPKTEDWAKDMERISSLIYARVG